MKTSSKRVLRELQHRGVTVISPKSVYLDPDIDPERISRENVVLYPGTRLIGAGTLIGPGCVIGEEAPVTLNNCALGKRVHFRGGYATKAAFLDDVVVGSGAQIREGCLLEEESSVAHCVGLKQTILMPYATVGSLVNFCDGLLAGGTTRRDHSEVGSGFVHFNFTPAATKATASLFGDVPRGVFLHEKRIFLGGQVGVVGPRRVGFGAVVGAGSVLREDVADDEFVVTGPAPDIRRPVRVAERTGAAKLARVFGQTVDYIGQLRTLRLWYTEVRWAYCGRFRLGALLNQACQDVLDAAIAERAKRLREYAAVIEPIDDAGRQVVDHVNDLLQAAISVELPVDHEVVAAVTEPALRRSAAYLETMAAVDPDTFDAGVAWLQSAVDTVGRAAAATVPDMRFGRWVS